MARQDQQVIQDIMVGTYLFLKVADITKDNGIYIKSFEFTIKKAGLKKTRKIEPNTLLLSNSGATLGVPKICLIEATFNDGIAAFLSLNEKGIIYLYYFWLSKVKELRAINQGAAQPNLNTSIISNITLPFCSLQEQHQIVREIETRLSVCDKLEATITESLQKSEALRQSILKRAFEGELLNETELEEARNAPDWEPADKLLERIKVEKEKQGTKKSFWGTPSE
ncbi:MAG: Type-1 restriction enzyme MjaXIP specificity protein [Candidatus Methanophagaceae archaeon]|nr:MAG: Type-1 restriction enzyme MjaXIP specificity protein [Methanophagales archaeon]